ncbi:hypothetical protein BKA70DRAFT_1565335 [Coprinopsis sp. MPI-PUGE-AT-0042]|nr:hypothetical protein BKA70DRAFT_1565335 [Coprinopsis sp. MPI-PUGE-AT-0042]
MSSFLQLYQHPVSVATAESKKTMSTQASLQPGEPSTRRENFEHPPQSVLPQVAFRATFVGKGPILLEYFYGSFHATAGLDASKATGIDLSKPKDFALVPYRAQMSCSLDSCGLPTSHWILTALSRLKIEKPSRPTIYARATANDWNLILQPGITVGVFKI